MINPEDVNEITNTIIMYRRYAVISMVIALVFMVLSVIMWTVLNISYDFQVLTGIAARKGIKKYIDESRTIHLDNESRTKYKNFIMVQELISAKELPKGLQIQ
ncbi:MAG: hypothetical protein K6A23_11645 [Butyrivibrio sp.]|nr:hypothetical protein [Butyrivibrio sp.]